MSLKALGWQGWGWGGQRRWLEGNADGSETQILYDAFSTFGEIKGHARNIIMTLSLVTGLQLVLWSFGEHLLCLGSGPGPAHLWVLTTSPYPAPVHSGTVWGSEVYVGGKQTAQKQQSRVPVGLQRMCSAAKAALGAPWKMTSVGGKKLGSRATLKPERLFPH